MENQGDFFPWYRSWWGQFLIFIGGAVFLFLAFVIALGLSSSGDSSTKVEQASINRSNEMRFNGLSVNDFGDPNFGPKDAPIQLYEFSDFGCPFCREASLIIKEVLKEYEGQVYWVYKDFPLVQIHPGADRAAQAAQCAWEQGKFIQMHDSLFEDQGRFDDTTLISHAKKIGLRGNEFEDCLTSNKFKNEVESDYREAISLGFTSTPTWLINGVKFEGSLSIEQWRAIFDEVLKSEN